MFCKNCGTEIKEGAKFCPNCGAPVQVERPVYQEPAPVHEEPVSGEYNSQQEQGSYTPPVYSAPAEEPNYYQAEMPQQQSYQGEAPSATLWIVLSVLELICCSPLGGIIALIFSILGSSAINKGDFADANQKLKIAKIVLIAGAALGIIVGIVSFFFSLGSNLYY